MAAVMMMVVCEEEEGFCNHLSLVRARQFLGGFLIAVSSLLLSKWSKNTGASKNRAVCAAAACKTEACMVMIVCALDAT